MGVLSAVKRVFFGKRGRLWIEPTNAGRHLSDASDKRIQIYNTIDRGGFDWQVFAVAASGFFTDSYNLFATNIILASISYIYWPSNDPNDPNADSSGKWEVAINIATLGGSVVGQLLFGYLADRFGRRKLYGLELIIVIVSTLGLTQASAGFYDQRSGATSMSIQAWLIFYRCLQGIGIGGEYPMSAVITAEFASVRSRARMMASVFLMQPLGQLVAAIIGLAAVYGLSSDAANEFGPSFGANLSPDFNYQNDDAALTANVQIDKLWRLVIGVGAIPAFIAIIFRLTIPESPRYTLDVDMDASRALRDTLDHYRYSESISTIDTVQSHEPRHSDDMLHEAHSHSVDRPSFQLDRPSFQLDDMSPAASPRGSMIIDEPAPEPAEQGEQSFSAGFNQYLFTDGNWRWLFGASLAWFVLDFAYYGLAVNNPRTIAKMWASGNQTQHPGDYENSWNTDIDVGSSLSNDGDNIFYIIRNDALRSMITSTLGSLLGSILIIQIIPYVPRKTLLVWTFLLLSVLMVVTGGVLFAVFEKDAHAVVVTMYVIIQLVFNLGPNTLLFIYPAEIFPTRYRGTCYGIASASGKLAAVLVQAILPFARFGTHQNRASVNDAIALSSLWIIWGVLMLIGAFASWKWLPEVQKPRSAEAGEDAFSYRIPSKTLEELAEGRVRSDAESGVLRKRISKLFSKEKRGRGRGSSGPNGNARQETSQNTAAS